MTRQVISTGTTANDGTGDTLRSAGTKINANFLELYGRLGGDTPGQVTFEDSAIVFEGNAIDNNETRIFAVEPTGDRSIFIPNYSGSFVLDSSTETLKNKTLFQPYVDSATVDRLLIEDVDKSHKYNLVPGNLTGNRNISLPSLSSNDTFTFNSATQVLSNKRLYKPRIFESLLDSTGNKILQLDRQGTISYIKIDNANNPEVEVVSSGNANLILTPSGTGTVVLGHSALKTASWTSGQSVGGGSLDPWEVDSVSHINSTKNTKMWVRVENGTISGQMKYVTNETSGTGDIDIQFDNANNFATGNGITLHPNGAVALMWGTSQWFVVGGLDSDHQGNRLMTIT